MSLVAVAPVRFDDPLVAAVHREILVPAFSPEELITEAALRHGMEAGGTTLLIASEGSDVLGAAVTEGGPGDEVHLLAYLATRSGLRSRGIGSALMTELLRRWTTPDGPALVLAEVHDPDRWATTDAERPVARLRFYARFGARRLPFMWVQPRIAPALDRVTGMALLALHVREPVLVPPAGLARDVVVRWIVETQEGAEGPGAGKDPELAAVRAAAQQTNPIPLLDLAANPG